MNFACPARRRFRQREAAPRNSPGRLDLDGGGTLRENVRRGRTAISMWCVSHLAGAQFAPFGGSCPTGGTSDGQCSRCSGCLSYHTTPLCTWKNLKAVHFWSVERSKIGKWINEQRFSPIRYTCADESMRVRYQIALVLLGLAVACVGGRLFWAMFLSMGRRDICPRCGAANINESAARSYTDRSFRMIRLNAYRCGSCDFRFHRPRIRARAEQGARTNP
jgi:hypothetical protein